MGGFWFQHTRGERTRKGLARGVVMVLLAGMLSLGGLISCAMAPEKYQDDYTITLYNLGNSYRELQKYEDAVAVYREALRREPNLEEARVNLYITLIDLKDYQKAVPVIEELVKDNPSNITYKKQLAYTYYLKGSLSKARKTYQQVYDLNPTDLDVLVKIAQLYELDKDYVQAREVYVTLDQLGEGTEDIYMSLGKIDEKTSQDTAIQWYQLAYIKNGSNTEAIESLIRIYKDQENHRQVLDTYELLEEATSSGNKGTPTFEKATYALLITEDYLVGLKDFQEALELGFGDNEEEQERIDALMEEPSLAFLADQFELILAEQAQEAEGAELEESDQTEQEGAQQDEAEGAEPEDPMTENFEDEL